MDYFCCFPGRKGESVASPSHFMGRDRSGMDEEWDRQFEKSSWKFNGLFMIPGQIVPAPKCLAQGSCLRQSHALFELCPEMELC